VLQEERDPLIEHFQNVDLNAVDAAYQFDPAGEERARSTRQQETPLRKSLTEQDLGKAQASGEPHAAQAEAGTI
jgi:hypothetical protein|tara:strand:- start:1026 stop:1247 length:222 start_codon:yes stop_codon:yes gene_type:complete